MLQWFARAITLQTRYMRSRIHYLAHGARLGRPPDVTFRSGEGVRKAFSRARDARGVGATVDDVYKTVRNKLRAPTPLYVTPHAHDTPERGHRPSLAL